MNLWVANIDYSCHFEKLRILEAPNYKYVMIRQVLDKL